MRGSMVVYFGLVIAFAGLIFVVKPPRLPGISTRLRALAVAGGGLALAAIGLALPASESRIKRVRADDIFLFGTLTWIRRGGRPLPKSILDAGSRNESLIDIALQGGFVSLADDFPKELVVGTVVVAPPGTRGPLTPQVFQRTL